VSSGDDRAELGWWSIGAADHTLYWGLQREGPVRKGKGGNWMKGTHL